ncbi:hypothetical protein Esti_006080 [Eimeria stiedai]
MDSRPRRGVSFRYRRIAPSSTTDDTLFRSSLRSKQCGTLYVTGRDTAIELNPSLDSQASGSSFRSSARLSLEDLSRIERLKDLKRIREVSRHLEEEDLEERIARAAELRKRMGEIDSERRSRGIFNREAPPSPSNSILSRAQEANEENREEVRAMNSIILKCKVDAIRRRQIELKREAAANREKLQKELDAMMEEERGQLERRVRCEQLKRELELEERERERVLILRQMEALKLEDESLKRQKEETARRMQLEVNAHNQKQREALELLEEEKIVQYNREKYAREKEQEARKKELEAVKQRGYAAICAKQDREIDKAAQLDALRARRAMEERERTERQKEELDLQRQKKINDELAEARLQQHRAKMLKLVESAIAEKRDFEQVAASQRAAAEAEQARRSAEKSKRLEHMRELRKQIEQRSFELEKLKAKQSEEAEALRLAEEEDRRWVERARERKLAELQKLADSGKYIAQLRRVQCAK